MKDIIELLKACQIIINALAVRSGMSYHPASMVELSNKISVAIAKLEPDQETSEPDRNRCSYCLRPIWDHAINCPRAGTAAG